MRFIVCGGRDYTDSRAVFHALDRLRARGLVTAIIHGGARGADAHAGSWAEQQAGVELVVFEADWERDGRAAGPKRNARMIAEGRPDGVVAFPGGRGTADMTRQAEAAGIKVWRPEG